MIGLPDPTSADEGKVVVVSGGQYVLTDKLKLDESNCTWDIGLPLHSYAQFDTAFRVRTNNIGALSQDDRFGTQQNLMYMSQDSTICLGPGHDNGVNGFMAYSPINPDKRNLKWDFNEASWPAGLDIRSIGAGYDIAYTGDSRVQLTTRNVTVGDGVFVIGNNLAAATNRRTQLYFTLALLQDPDCDLQFGLSSLDSTNQIRFRYAAASGVHDVLTCSIYNGSTPNTIRTSWTAISERRKFLLWIPPGGSGNVEFYAANSNNEFTPDGLIASFPLSDPAMPSPSVRLYPWLQMRTMDYPSRRTLELDTIELNTEW